MIMAEIEQALPLVAVRRRSQSQRRWQTFARNRTALAGLAMAILILFTAIFADDWFLAAIQGRDAQPLLAPYDPTKQDTRRRLEGMSAEHPMGMDNYGRDILSRTIYGARVSLLVGIASVLLGGLVGTFLGIAAGYTGGKLEDAIMRSTDVLMAFPSLIMGLMVLAVLGSGIPKMVVAIGIMLSPAFVRVSHSSTLAIKQNDYILAARSVGVGHMRSLRRHVLPNLLGEIVVLSSVWAASAIRVEASLSFIGLGVSPPTPAWGTMIRDGTQHLTNAPWISLFPGLAILVTVLAFNLLGDGLRDILDPKSYE
jgi:peptide/nickel transport system permease protein